MNSHECSWDTIIWEISPEGIPLYTLGGLGETLERKGYCKCGKIVKEIYLKHGIYDEEGNEVL